MSGARAAAPADRKKAVECARDIVVAAADASAGLRDRFDPSAFDAALELIDACRVARGRIHVTGVGKPEHLARYAASLFASTGTPAYFLHATEAVHGGSGQVVDGDVVVAVSNSGSTEELLRSVALVRSLGAEVIAVVGDPESPLAREAAVVLEAAVPREGGELGLAPRASAGAALAVLAALSAGLEALGGWTRADYHRHHPAGALGRKSRP